MILHFATDYAFDALWWRQTFSPFDADSLIILRFFDYATMLQRRQQRADVCCCYSRYHADGTCRVCQQPIRGAARCRLFRFLSEQYAALIQPRGVH